MQALDPLFLLVHSTETGVLIGASVGSLFLLVHSAETGVLFDASVGSPNPIGPFP